MGDLLFPQKYKEKTKLTVDCKFLYDLELTLMLQGVSNNWRRPVLRIKHYVAVGS